MPGKNAARTIKSYEQALLKARGNRLAAAQLLGVTRQAVAFRIEKSEYLTELVKRIEQEEIDTFEAKVRQMALNQGHPTMVLAYLNAKAADRGWGRQNVAVKGNVHHDHKGSVQHQHDISALSPQELVQAYREMIGNGNGRTKH